MAFTRAEGEHVEGARHGTRLGYTSDFCRCADCRRAWAAYMRPYMRKRRAAGLDEL